MGMVLDNDVGDPFRWVVLAIFCVYSSSNAIQWVTFASIATNTKLYFGITTSELNMLSLVYMIVFVVGAFFSCTTFEHWGVRPALLAGGTLNALGSVLKVAPGLQYPRYATLIVPQSLSAISQLFVLSTPPLIAAQYFPPHRRAFATAIMATANNIGNAAALIVTPFIVKRGEHSEFMLLFCLIMGYSVSALIAVIFFVKAPRYLAPSAALLSVASPTSEEEPEDFEAAGHGKKSNSAPARTGRGAEPSEDGAGAEGGRKRSLRQRLRANTHVVTFIEVGYTIVLLLKKRDFLFLLCAFSISMGSVWTFASVLAQILEPFGVSAELSGIAGALNVVVGVLAAYAVGLWVDRARRYKFPVLTCLAGAVVCCTALIVVMLRAPPNTSVMNGTSMFIYILAGMFQNTATPISFEFAMEITYPMPESVPGTLLMAGANLVSLVLLAISSAMLGNGETEKMSAVYVVVLITCVCVAGTVLAVFPRERLHRHTAELVAREQVSGDARDTVKNFREGKDGASAQLGELDGCVSVEPADAHEAPVEWEGGGAAAPPQPREEERDAVFLR